MHQLTTQQRAARAQHLALATLPRTSPDRIETARLAERSAAINLAEARQSLAAARQL